jgi:putative transposase
LAVVIDLYSHKAIGWTADDKLKKTFTLTTWRRAPVTRRPVPVPLHHSERGSHYCFNAHQADSLRHTILITPFGRGKYRDNTMIEHLLKAMKNDLISRTIFHTRAKAVGAQARYIDRFDDPSRCHSALDVTSPTRFEMRAVPQSRSPQAAGLCRPSPRLA